MELIIIKPQPKTIRQELEANIRGFNKCLHNAMKTMDWNQLLANSHPYNRPKFAWRLFKAGMISKDILTIHSPKRD